MQPHEHTVCMRQLWAPTRAVLKHTTTKMKSAMTSRHTGFGFLCAGGGYVRAQNAVVGRPTGDDATFLTLRICVENGFVACFLSVCAMVAQTLLHSNTMTSPMHEDSSTNARPMPAPMHEDASTNARGQQH